MRIGHGYDVHRLVPERSLVLGGVSIPHSHGLLGHSDADVLLHAICDALLGALGLGDLGRHFPDTDPAYAGIASTELLRHVINLTRQNSYTIGNLDATIIAQKPRLAQHIPAMVNTIAALCACACSRVNVKATTTEKLGFEGRLEGISAHAVVVLQHQDLNKTA
ncbi:MAG: 2-C-methyl-D-erythritol 2,4-cyclodiphosphate synthase [Desulfuromonadaceae bacterium]